MDRQEIYRKIEAYRRKFHLNRIIRGSVLLLLLVIGLGLVLSLSEGALWMGKGWRTVATLGFLLLTSAVFVWGIVRPASHYFGYNDPLTPEHIAKQIGQGMPEVQDRLLNFVQLDRTRSQQESGLLLAALDQRIGELRPISFSSSISFQPNLRLARWLAVPLVLAILIFFIQPDWLSGGSYRLLNFRQDFVPPAPFEIAVAGHEEQLTAGQDHTIDINVTGHELPEQLFLFYKPDGQATFERYSLESNDLASYSFTFRNLSQDFSYYIGNELHGSSLFNSDVVYRPGIQRFSLKVVPPAYTGAEPFELGMNVGDVQVPAGSRITWQFSFKRPVDRAIFQGTSNDTLELKRGGSESTHQLRVVQPFSYRLALANADGLTNDDSVRYTIAVMPDKYPTVVIQQPESNISLPPSGLLGIAALATDDYGLTRARLEYKIIQAKTPERTMDDFKAVNVRLQGSGRSSGIVQVIDWFELGIQQGDQVEYRVRVWDNDGVVGAKSAVSASQLLNYASTQDLQDDFNQSANELEKDLAEMIEESQRIAEQIQAFQDKLLQKQSLSYEDQQELNELLDRQAKLQESIRESRQKLSDMHREGQRNELFSEPSGEQLEQLGEMMEEYEDPEWEEFMQELQKNSDNLPKRFLQQQLEQMDQKNQDLQQDMERTLELFQRWKESKKAEELEQQLKAIEQRQEAIEEQTQQQEQAGEKGERTDAEREAEQQKLEEQQRALQEQMEKAQEGLDQLDSLQQQGPKGQSEEQQQQMDDLHQQAEQIQQEMKQAEQQLQQGDNKGAQQRQQRARQQLQQMQQELQQMQQQQQQDEMGENYEDLRNLLENLVDLSLDQEALRDEMGQLRYNDPLLKEKVQKQEKIRDDMRMVEDSLVALAKRVFVIEQTVMAELRNVRNGLQEVVRYLDESQVPRATGGQHRVMTSLNNLANMLVESLSQMQNAMMQQQQQQRQGMSMQRLIQMQQQLNQQMQQQMQQGQMTQEQLAEFARRQEEIRQALQEQYEQLRKQQEQGTGGLQKAGEEMGQTEEDLRNQQLNEEIMKRQQRILDRLLDFDKAMREREFEKQRKADTSKEQRSSDPAAWDEEELQRQLRQEQLHLGRFRYAPYYQQLIERYYQALPEKPASPDSPRD